MLQIIIILDVKLTDQGEEDQKKDPSERFDGSLLEQELILHLPEGVVIILHAPVQHGHG